MTDEPKHYKLHAEAGKYEVTGNPVTFTWWDAAVTKMKRIRESLGQTHEKQLANFSAWYSLAQSFRCAAQVLDECKDRIPSDTRPFAFNAALSLELIFKAILAKKGLPIPSGPSGHDLRLLSNQAQVALSPQQMLTLELMTEEIVWAGRYPVPNRAQRWDDFHDRIFEKHIVRTQTEIATTARANSETFPNWENCSKIWQVAAAKFNSVK